MVSISPFKCHQIELYSSGGPSADYLPQEAGSMHYVSQSVQLGALLSPETQRSPDGEHEYEIKECPIAVNEFTEEGGGSLVIRTVTYVVPEKTKA